MNWARDISRSAVLRLVLAVVMLLQASLSATAMARMDAARLAPDGSLVETVICTADGLKTVKIPPGKNDRHEHQDCDCPCATLCAAFNAANLAPDIDTAPSGPDWHASKLPAPLRTIHLPGSDAGEWPGSPRSPPLPA